MTSKYHQLIVRGLLELGDELTKKQIVKTRFEKVFDGNKYPIRIINPRRRQLMGWNYYPDVYYLTKVERKFIFEVIDKEADNDIIADFIQAILSPASHVIIFIAPKEKADEVWAIMDTVAEILKEELNVKKLPYRELWEIDRKEIKDIKTTKKLLMEKLKYWYREHPVSK